MKNVHKLGLTAIVGLAIMSSQAMALEQGEHRLNGFGTLGFNYLGAESEGAGYGVNGQTTTSWRGDELSKLGGQVNYGITDNLSATLQVLAKANHDSWELNPEWAYLAYKASDKLTLRAGRLGTSYYMYSESLNVGFTYPWLSLPTEVYGQVQLNNYEGADLIYNHNTPFGQLSFQASAGQAKNRKQYFSDSTHDLDFQDAVSASFLLSTHAYGDFRIAYSEADISVDINEPIRVFTGTGFAPGQLAINYDQLKGKYTSIGHKFDNGTYLTSAEMTHLNIEGDGKQEAIAYYIMGGRRFGDYLGHLTYGNHKEDGMTHSSWTVGMNYSVLPNVTLKSEYKQVRADAGSGYAGFDKTPQDVYNDGLHQATGFLGKPFEDRSAEIISVGLEFVF